MQALLCVHKLVTVISSYLEVKSHTLYGCELVILLYRFRKNFQKFLKILSTEAGFSSLFAKGITFNSI